MGTLSCGLHFSCLRTCHHIAISDTGLPSAAVGGGTCIPALMDYIFVLLLSKWRIYNESLTCCCRTLRHFLPSNPFNVALMERSWHYATLCKFSQLKKKFIHMCREHRQQLLIWLLMYSHTFGTGNLIQNHKRKVGNAEEWIWVWTEVGLVMSLMTLDLRRSSRTHKETLARQAAAVYKA